MPQTLNLVHFAQQQHTPFRVILTPSQSLELQLAEAADLGSTPRQEQFSLVFHGPADLFLQQGIYHMEHAELGALDLFLVPIGRQAAGFAYQAIFNRLVKAEC